MKPLFGILHLCCPLVPRVYTATYSVTSLLNGMTIIPCCLWKDDADEADGKKTEANVPLVKNSMEHRLNHNQSGSC